MLKGSKRPPKYLPQTKEQYERDLKQAVRANDRELLKKTLERNGDGVDEASFDGSFDYYEAYLHAMRIFERGLPEEEREKSQDFLESIGFSWHEALISVFESIQERAPKRKTKPPLG